MMDRSVRFCIATFVLLVSMAWVSVCAQTTSQVTQPSTTKTTTPPKPAPKPVPAVPVAKPAPAKPAAVTTPTPNPASRTAVRTVTTTSTPAGTSKTTVTTTTPVGVRPLPARGVVAPGITPGGKGAAIGAAPASAKGSAAATTTSAPAVAGRPAIPTPTAASAAVPSVNGRSAIPTATSGRSASTSYLPSSSSSGRSVIPTYGSSSSSAAAAASGPATPGPNGSLGTFEYGQGMLTIYGCTRQGTQVLCDTDFNNQNQRLTQINTAWWRDVYLVDQYGDRHQRASAYFVNGAGEPREMLDIPYGGSARYIMVFNDFSANVGTVGLHSAYGNIDIENMSLDGSGGAAAGGDQAAQANTQGNSAVGNSVNGVTDSLKNSGKQRASDAKDKAVNKANDSMQKLMDRIPH
jgi:hypothetical protein